MTELINTLDAKLFIAKTRAQEFFKDLKDGEYGVSAVIATVVLVAIAMILAVAFWGKIAEVYKRLGGQIDTSTQIKADDLK